MDGAADPSEGDASRAGGTEDALSATRAALAQAVHVVEAALALLRSELRLARSSAMRMVWLGLVLIFLGIGAWLATGAAIAAGIYQLTGNLFFGVGSVALANLIGLAWVLSLLRRCWRDLGLPRTRRMLGGMGQPSARSAASSAATSLWRSAV